MRVAILGPYPIDHIPDQQPGRGILGGVDAVVVALVDEMASRPDVEVHVLCSVEGLERVQHIRRERLELHLVPQPRGDRLLWHQPSVRLLRQTLIRIAPDIAHAHMTGPYADAVLQSPFPKIVTPHGVVSRESTLAMRYGSFSARARWWIDAKYERWVTLRARDLIAISPYMIRECQPYTHARFHLIENPVAEAFFGVPDAAGKGATVLCVARVMPRKDILTLLEVFARVRQALPAAVLEIAGQTDADPDYVQLCLRKAHELNIEDAVTFLGNLHGKELLDAYGRAQLVMLTSLQETAPVTIAEAMAAGRAVVATSVGGVSDMIADGVTGILAPSRDIAALEGAALSLLRNPDRRTAFEKAARREARQRFRADAIVDRTLCLYEEIIARDRNG